MKPHRLIFSVAAMLTVSVALAHAETRQALVMSARASGQSIGEPARDGLQMSRALLAAGFDVRRLENPASLPQAPVEPPDIMLIYVSADLLGTDGKVAVDLPMGSVPLADLADRYGGAGQLILLAESCPAIPEDDQEAQPPVPASAAPVPAANALIALSPGAGAVCGESRLTDALLQALSQPGAELGVVLEAAGIEVERGDDSAPLVFRPAVDTVMSTENLIITGPAVQPPSLVSPAAALTSGGVRIFTAAAPQMQMSGDRQFRPTADGLPQPSIIVGDLPPDPDAERLSGTLEGTSLGGSYEERRRIRQEDEALFTSLLESGAFDPPEGQMAAAIQTELQRMNCYRSRVDGIWGNGSRQAVDSYFGRIDAAAASREADATLFRQIALRDDVRCPDPVVRTPTPTATARRPSNTNTNRRPGNSTGQTAASTAQRRPTAQVPAQPEQPRINPNTLGSGIFR